MVWLKAIAGAKYKELFNENGTLLPPLLWPDSLDDAIDSFEVEEMKTGALGITASAAGFVPRFTKKVKLANKLQTIMRLVDIGMGVNGKPSTAVQMNVPLDREAITQRAIDRLFSKCDPEYVPGSA